MRGMRYSEFINGLQRALCILDRKSLSEIAIHDPGAFDQLVELARKNLHPNMAEAHAHAAKS